MTKDAKHRPVPGAVRTHLDELAAALSKIANGEDASDQLDAALDRAVRAASHEARDQGHADPFAFSTDFAETIASNIRRCRTEAGWTQQQLAEAMSEMGFDWKRSTASEVEAGTRRATLEEVCGLAALFAVPMIDFLLLAPSRHLELNRTTDIPAETVRELLIGNGGKIGSGGARWRAAARVSGSPEDGAIDRPAAALWRHRRRAGSGG